MATSHNRNEDKDDDWSTQATQGSDSEEENNEKKSDQQPPPRYPVSLDEFAEFFELDNRRLRRYIIDNPRKYSVENPVLSVV